MNYTEQQIEPVTHCPMCEMPLAENGGCYYPECCEPQKPRTTTAPITTEQSSEIADRLVELRRAGTKSLFQQRHSIA
jgi:hypothetical protein